MSHAAIIVLKSAEMKEIRSFGHKIVRVDGWHGGSYKIVRKSNFDDDASSRNLSWSLKSLTRSLSARGITHGSRAGCISSWPSVRPMILGASS
jgi:hypothetical protein